MCIQWARSRNHCWEGKAKNIKSYVCVCIFSCFLRCIFWPAWLYRIFPHFLLNDTILGKNYLIRYYGMIFDTTFVWNISHSKNN